MIGHRSSSVLPLINVTPCLPWSVLECLIPREIGMGERGGLHAMKDEILHHSSSLMGQ